MGNETELIYRISKGDKIAFKKLYELYSNKIYSTVMHYLQNIEDSQEVTQDIFVKIFKNSHKFKGNSSISTWIYRISVNTSLNYLKKRNRTSLLFLDSKKESVNFEHPGILEQNKEAAILMYTAINSLPDNQRTAFILGYIDEKPRQEIADIMEVSLKAVESLLQRAKVNLRKKLYILNPNRRN